MCTTATTFLECERENCILKLIPPTRQKSLTLKVHRNQMILVKHISVNSKGEYDIAQRHYRDVVLKDEELFDSYGLVLAQDGKEMDDLKEIDNKLEEEQKRGEESKKSGSTSDEDQQVNEAELWKDMLKDGVITHDQMLFITQHRSAAMKDPDLMEKFEKQKEALVAKMKKEKRADPTRDSVNRQREHLERMQQLHEEKRRKIEEWNRRDVNYPRLEELYGWSEMLEEGKYMVVMRKYNIGHKRRRTSSLMRSISSYIEGKKERLIIRENRNVAWQGILGLILGMFSFLLCLLIGQFWDPVETKKKYRSPGSHANSIRRKHVDHLTAQGPPRVPSSFPSSSTRSRKQASRPKAYGGYMPGKSTY